MKKVLFLFVTLSLLAVCQAQNKKEKRFNKKDEIIKTG